MKLYVYLTNTLLALFLLLSTNAYAYAQSVTDLSVGGTHFCALDENGIVDCITEPFSTRLQEPEGLPPFTDVATGSQHACGLTIDGGAICWGQANFGALNVPPLVYPLVSIAAGYHHTCGIDTQGSAICWGLNTNLQLEPPPTANGFIEVDASRNFSCGILAEGDMTCWSTDLEFGNRTLAGPFTDMDLSRFDACGLTVNGEISCLRVAAPTPPQGGPYVDLALAPGALCGLTADGQLDCSLADFRTSPALAAEFADATENERFNSIDSAHSVFGGSVICGITAAEGTVLCIGDNSFGQTSGVGSTTVENIELGLTGIAYGPTEVELFWNRQPSQFPPILIEIFRDGELLTTTGASFSFFDRDNIEQTESTYVIRATDENGNLGPFSNEITVSREILNTFNSNLDTDLTNPRTSDLRIENLTLFTPGSFGSFDTIILNWDLLDDADTAVPVAGYESRQNNETLALTRANVYTNSRIDLDFCGTFSVLAIGEDGQILETASTPLVNRGRFCR